MTDYQPTVYEIGADKLATQIRAQESTDEDLFTRFVASTATPDRATDIVRQDWRLRDYRSNPVILWGHNASIPPVGRAVESKVPKEGPGLLITVEWDESDENALGRLMASQYRRGFLSAGSVGFTAGKRTLRAELPEDHAAYQKLPKGTPTWAGGVYYEQNSLLEFSAVGIPMNPEALAIRAWAAEGGDSADQLQRYLRETGTRSLADEVLDLITRDQRVRRSLAALLLTEGPAPTNPPPASGLGHLFTTTDEDGAPGLAHLWSTP